MERKSLTYGNLAYKYDYMDEEVKVKEKQEKISSEPKKKKKSKRRAARGRAMSRAGQIACVIIVSSAAVFMISQFVEVNEMQSELSAAKSKFAFEESVTAQKSFELEQSIDLSKIEAEATTRLGMRRPERYQMVYLDVKRDDTTETTADEVEGFGKTVAKGFKQLVSNIVEFFSI